MKKSEKNTVNTFSKITYEMQDPSLDVSVASRQYWRSIWAIVILGDSVKQQFFVCPKRLLLGCSVLLDELLTDNHD